MLSHKKAQIISFIFCCALSAHAQTDLGAKGSTASISGKVTIKDKGAAGITVGLRLEETSRAVRYRAVTDEEGNYKIINVPPGHYQVVPVAPGFISGDTVGRGRTIIVSKDEAIENVDLPLVRGGIITGRVTDAEGRPVIEEEVSLHPMEVPRGFYQMPRGARTDDRGIYRIYGLPSGKYRVGAGAGDFVPRGREGIYKLTFHPAAVDISQASVINVTEGGETTNVDITFGRPPVTGKVTTSEGEPIVAIEVRAEAFRDPSGRRYERAPVKSGATDDRGVYRIYGLPTGTYLVVAGGPGYDYSRTGINAFESHVPTYAPSATRESAAEVSVRAGEETTDVDIRYRAEPGRVISGTASGPAGDGTGFNVVLTTVGEGGSQSNKSTQREPGSREFVFNGLIDGDYYLTAESHLASGEKAVSESKLINVRGADVTGIELVTQPLASISGRVVLEETRAVECTEKRPPVFAETTVFAWHKEQEANKDRARFILSWQEAARADGEGNITLRNLIAGDYRFVTQFSARDWYLRSIVFAPSRTKTPTAKPIDAMKTWTRVKSGDRLTGLKITLAQGAASLTVQVETGAGQTIPEKLFLYLIPAEPKKPATCGAFMLRQWLVMGELI